MVEVRTMTRLRTDTAAHLDGRPGVHYDTDLMDRLTDPKANTWLGGGTVDPLTSMHLNKPSEVMARRLSGKIVPLPE